MLDTQNDYWWPMLLSYGTEKEAAAFLATAAKVARRALGASRESGGDFKACNTILSWLHSMGWSLFLQARDLADLVGQRTVQGGGASSNGAPGSMRWREAGSNGSGSSDGGGGGEGSRSGSSDGDGDGKGGGGTGNSGGDGNSGGGGGDGCEGDTPPPSSTGGSSFATPAPATHSATATADNLSHPEQQLLRLVSFGLTLWLPLWVELLSASLQEKRLVEGSWHAEALLASNLLATGLRSLLLALQRGNTRAAESWKGLLGSAGELQILLVGCRQVQVEADERKGEGTEGGAQGHGEGAEGQEGGSSERKELLDCLAIVSKLLILMDLDVGRELSTEEIGVSEGWEGASPLLGLLAPPCDARQLLACCSNPRCAELVGDSEAGVVLRRCGGACGGAAAYCCVACQRAHWAAGHREECTGKGMEGKSGIECGGS